MEFLNQGWEDFGNEYQTHEGGSRKEICDPIQEVEGIKFLLFKSSCSGRLVVVIVLEREKLIEEEIYPRGVVA